MCQRMKPTDDAGLYDVTLSCARSQGPHSPEVISERFPWRKGEKKHYSEQPVSSDHQKLQCLHLTDSHAALLKADNRLPPCCLLAVLQPQDGGEKKLSADGSAVKDFSSCLRLAMTRSDLMLRLSIPPSIWMGETHSISAGLYINKAFKIYMGT